MQQESPADRPDQGQHRVMLMIATERCVHVQRLARHLGPEVLQKALVGQVKDNPRGKEDVRHEHTT